MTETTDAGGAASPSEQIDAKIAALGDWRGPTLARMRALIRAADPGVVEAVRWRKPTNPSGVPAWERDGILCTGESYKGYVKLTFARGAALADPSGLLDAGLGGGTMRAIDIREGKEVDAEAFTALVRAAAERNAADRAERPAPGGPRARSPKVDASGQGKDHEA